MEIDDLVARVRDAHDRARDAKVRAEQEFADDSDFDRWLDFEDAFDEALSALVEADKKIRYLGLMLQHCAHQYRNDRDAVDVLAEELDKFWMDGTSNLAEQDWRDGTRHIAEIVPEWPEEKGK